MLLPEQTWSCLHIPASGQRVTIPFQYLSRKILVVKIKPRCLRSNHQATRLSADVVLQPQISRTATCCNVCLANTEHCQQRTKPMATIPQIFIFWSPSKNHDL